MRFLSTTLLLGSVGVITSGVVIAAPVRVVVGKGSASGSAAVAPDAGAAAAIEAFLRSVRIGHAAANANPNDIVGDAAGSSDEMKDRVRIALDEMMIEPALAPIPVGSPLFSEGSSLASADRPRVPVPVPMTPEGEFEMPTLMEEMMMEMKEAEKEVETESRRLKAWLDQKLGWKHESKEEERGCRVVKEGSMREKMEEMNDWVRSLLGLAAVERVPLCSPDAAVTATATIVRGKKMLPPPLPIDLPLATFPSSGSASGADVAGAVPPRMPCHRGASRPDNGSNEIHILPMTRPVRTSVWIQHLHRQRPTTFWGRLHRALYALSPWEGRALAFVIGCGLGVLVRMIYVFIILGVRMWRRQQKEREEGFLHLPGDEEGGDEIVGVVLFDAASIKGSASEDDLPLYTEKE